MSKELIGLLEKAEAVILRAENMCMASDGPVSPTITEISDDDIKEIYKAVHQAITKLREVPKPNLWLTKDYLKKALKRFEIDGKHWVGEALKIIEGEAPEQPPAGDFTKECREYRSKGATKSFPDIGLKV